MHKNWINANKCITHICILVIDQNVIYWATNLNFIITCIYCFLLNLAYFSYAFKPMRTFLNNLRQLNNLITNFNRHSNTVFLSVNKKLFTNNVSFVQHKLMRVIAYRSCLCSRNRVSNYRSHADNIITLRRWRLFF